MRRVALATVALAGLLGCFVPAQSISAASGTRASMSRRLPPVNFTGIALGDAIDFLRDVSGQNINVNWKALAEANVTPDTPINVRLRDVSMRKVLSTILTEAGGGDTLTFFVEDNVIEITTRALADQKVYTKVYPVDDLLVEVPDFTQAPNFTLQQNRSQGGGGGGGQGGGGGGGGQGGLFGNSAQGDRKEENLKTKQERADELVALIVETIKPDVWRENGGTASIKYYNGNLIVSAPLTVHEMLGGVR